MRKTAKYQTFLNLIQSRFWGKFSNNLQFPDIISTSTCRMTSIFYWHIPLMLRNVFNNLSRLQIPGGGGRNFHGRICCGENDDFFVFPPLLRTLKYSKNLKDFPVKYLTGKSLRFFEYFRVRSSGGKTKKSSFSPQHIRPWKFRPPPPGICSRLRLLKTFLNIRGICQ